MVFINNAAITKLVTESGEKFKEGVIDGVMAKFSKYRKADKAKIRNKLEEVLDGTLAEGFPL